MNWSLRYGPVLDLLEGEAGTVLDVGAGAWGLAHQRPGTPVVSTDLAFTQRPPAGARPVRSTAEALPFPARSFSCVVSLDLLEHLPPGLRPLAVAEMVRVTNGRVIVGFPCQPNARPLDERLARWFQSRQRELPEWLAEHLELEPVLVDDVLAAVPDVVTVTSVLRNTNVHVQHLVIIAEHTRVAARVAAALAGAVRPPRLNRWLSRGEVYRAIVVLDRAPC